MAIKDKDAERLINSTGVNTDIPDDINSNIDFDVNSSLLSNTELTDIAGDKAKQLMTGEIPEDLREQVTDLSTATAMKGGFGMGEAGRKLVARDLGTTSLALQESGMNQAMAVNQSRNQTASLFKDFTDSNRNYQLALSNDKISKDQLALMGNELISKNQQYVAGLLNDLILNNSRNPIEGVQGNVDSLAGNTETGQAGYFDAANNSIMDIINKYM
jgi:hypothetical protein